MFQIVLKYLFIAFLSFFYIVVSSQERSLQFWNQNKLEVKISERYSIGASEKIHYEPKAGDVRLKYGDLSLTRHFTDWFDAGLSERMIWIKSENGWFQENRPMIFCNLSTKMGNLNFDLSNRFEYRMYKYLNDHFRHRHMLSVEMPPFNALTWFKFYLGEEAYFRFDEEHFHLARFHTGTKIKYRNFLEMKLFYALEKNKKPSHWATTDVLGLNLNLDF